MNSSLKARALHSTEQVICAGTPLNPSQGQEELTKMCHHLTSTVTQILTIFCDALFLGSRICSSRFLKIRVCFSAKNYSWIRPSRLYLRCRLYQLVPSLILQSDSDKMCVSEVIWSPACFLESC